MSRSPASPVWSRGGMADQAFLRLLPFADVAAACDMAYGLLFEQFFMPALRQPGAPTLSYGQMAGVMMLLAALLGAAVGAAVLWRTWIARVFAVAIPPLVALAANSLWNESLVRYGPDSSDYVLYVPILFGAAFCLAIVLTLIVVPIRR